MNRQELVEKFGEKIELDDINFLLKLTIPFTPITSESLEQNKRNFLKFIENRVFVYQPLNVITYELDYVPNGKPVTLNDFLINKLLDNVAYTLGRSGKFKNNCYIFHQDKLNFYYFNIKDLPNNIKNKMIFLLAPRISFLLENVQHYESAIINMMRQKRYDIVEGKKYCFLRAHILVDGEDRPKMKKELQIIFNFGVGKLEEKLFSETLNNFKFFKFNKI